VIAICPNCPGGITASMAKLAARAIPAVVMAREAARTAMATASAGASHNTRLPAIRLGGPVHVHVAYGIPSHPVGTSDPKLQH
jgi:hypothetical protein